MIDLKNTKKVFPIPKFCSVCLNKESCPIAAIPSCGNNMGYQLCPFFTLKQAAETRFGPIHSG